jgi:hypothetical protein
LCSFKHPVNFTKKAMQTTITLLILLLSNSLAFAQKSMTFQQAKDEGIFQQLDSLYRGGTDSDPAKAVFKDQKTYIAAYGQFINQLGSFLAKNNFKWGKQVRCFNKIYFSKTGKVDYFLYNFQPEQISPEQEIRFGVLLKEFIQTAKFGLEADTKFAQCSPVRYNDM